MKTSFSSISFIFFLLCIVRGDAHMRLTNPVPRSSSDNLTSGPCGGVAAKTPIQFNVGNSLDVKVGSTTGHTGTLSVNLLNPNQQFVSALFTRSANGASSYTMNVVLSQQCVGCVLQAVLKTSGTTWFSCSDVSVNSVVVVADEEDSDVLDETLNEDSDIDDSEGGDDNNQSQLSKENRDVLVQYISIIAASIVVIFVCVSLLVCNRNRRRRQAHRLHDN